MYFLNSNARLLRPFHRILRIACQSQFHTQDSIAAFAEAFAEAFAAAFAKKQQFEANGRQYNLLHALSELGQSQVSDYREPELRLNHLAYKSLIRH